MPLSNQKGLTSIFIIAAVSIVLLIGVFFIFQKKSPVPSIIQNNSVEKSNLNSNCEYSDSDLCKFLNQLKVASNYTRKSTNKTTNTEGNPVTFEDAYHYDDKGSSYWLMYRDGEVIQEQLLLEGKHYIKSDGGWTRIIDSTGSVYNPLKDKFKEQNLYQEEEEGKQVEPKKIKLKYEKVVKEACGDLLCFKYKLIDESGLSDKTRAAHIEFIWFDDKEYLLRKNQLDDNSDSTVELFSYEKVEFPEPSPVVKEMTGQEAFQ